MKQAISYRQKFEAIKSQLHKMHWQGKLYNYSFRVIGPVTFCFLFTDEQMIRAISVRSKKDDKNKYAGRTYAAIKALKELKRGNEDCYSKIIDNAYLKKVFNIYLTDRQLSDNIIAVVDTYLASLVEFRRITERDDYLYDLILKAIRNKTTIAHMSHRVCSAVGKGDQN